MFTPWNSLVVVCSPNCAIKLYKEKKKAKTAKMIKDSGKIEAKLTRKADRLLQQKYTQGLCESCQERMAICCHHYIYKSQSKFLRYSPSNLVPICAECHTRHHKSGDSQIMSRVIARRGIEWEQELQRQRRTPQKFTIEYLEEQISKLEK